MFTFCRFLRAFCERFACDQLILGSEVIKVFDMVNRRVCELIFTTIPRVKNINYFFYYLRLLFIYRYHRLLHY